MDATSYDEEECPEVDVAWWDARNFYIRCPYCRGIHGHRFNSYASGLRAPRCSGEANLPYRYKFPADEETGQVAYEIDKYKARFVNVCALEELAEYSDEEELADEFFSRATISTNPVRQMPDPNITEAAQETAAIKLDGNETEETKSIVFVLSDCVRGQVAQVQECLLDPSYAPHLLHGRNGIGDTTLIMASRGKSPFIISLLLDFGSDINAVNHEGRSALMEAALWGRLDNVKLLLEKGAKKRLCDRQKRYAIDLAQPTRENQRERRLRAGGCIGISQQEAAEKEDTLDRDADRRKIAMLLANGDIEDETVSSSPPTVSDCQDYSFRRSPDDRAIVFRGPIAYFPVTRNSKTIARLERGSLFPPVAAMSGWTHPECPPVRISGRYWTDEVFRIADIVGHSFTPDQLRDNGFPGRFNASHAEKQLIAYFIDRHVFLPRDRVPRTDLDVLISRTEAQLVAKSCSTAAAGKLHGSETTRERETLGLPLLDEEYNNNIKLKQLTLDIQTAPSATLSQPHHHYPSASHTTTHLQRQLRLYRQKQSLHQRLIAISEIPPPASLTKALILVSSTSSTICEDCYIFRDKVNRRFGLEIDWLECTEREGRVRRGEGG